MLVNPVCILVSSPDYFLATFSSLGMRLSPSLLSISSLFTRLSEVCHASVVFGVGKDCYMTETIESNDPEWNQEAHM